MDEDTNKPAQMHLCSTYEMEECVCINTHTINSAVEDSV